MKNEKNYSRGLSTITQGITLKEEMIQIQLVFQISKENSDIMIKSLGDKLIVS